MMWCPVVALPTGGRARMPKAGALGSYDTAESLSWPAIACPCASFQSPPCRGHRLSSVPDGHTRLHGEP